MFKEEREEVYVKEGGKGKGKGNGKESLERKDTSAFIPMAGIKMRAPPPSPHPLYKSLNPV